MIDFDAEIVPLSFYPNINRFVDEFGCVIHDIFKLITPGQLMIFKENKEVYVVQDVTNSFLIGLSYEDEEE